MIGCNKVTTKEYIIENSKIPKAFDEYTIVMLSDLHDNPIVDKIIKSVDMISPDIIVCAGDMPVSNVKYMDRQYIAEELMIKLAKQYRILYANGNHETKIKEREYKFGKYYEEYRLKLEDAGIEFINNKKYTIEKNGEHIVFTGYESTLGYYKKATSQILPVEELKKLTGTNNPYEYNILIAHNPVYFSTYEEAGYDLVFSGHVHGGIIRLPIIGGVCSPQVKLFPKYDKGRFDINDSVMILGAGLGTHTIPIRFNNPPEIVVVKLKKTY